MCAALVMLLAACAGRPERDEAFLAGLAAVLPGSYDNIAQARASPQHVALRLVIAPVQAGFLGRHVYYVQEMAADDAQRVLAQRLYVLEPIEGQERAVLLQADFAEPMRWRDGHLRRDLFKSLLPEDVRPRVGCDIVITRGPKGFVGSGRDTCRVSAPGTGETLRVEQKIELDADGLTIFERQRDAMGVLVRAEPEDPWYRFARRADAPW
jgi:hypothetical protein